jgi:hypothetical protein
MKGSACFVLFIIALICFILLIFFTNENNEIEEEISNSINVFARNLALEKSHSKIPAPVLSIGDPLYNGLFSIKVKPCIFELAKMAFELKPGFEKVGNSIGAYKHRHNFHVLTCFSNCEKVLYQFIPLLAQNRAYFLIDETIPNMKLVKEFQDWKVYELQSETKCTSQIIYDAIYKHCNLSQFPNSIYYVTSEQREDEIRQAYKDDRSFEAETLTGIIHGCVLKSMFPKINIIFQPKTKLDELFEKGKIFYNLHFV